MKDTYTKLIELLDKHKAKYRLINHAPEGRTEIVSPMRGNKLSQAAKCMVLTVHIGKKDTKYVLGVIPGDKQIDFNAVKNLFKASYVSFSPQDMTEKLAQSVVGTVLPLSFSSELELIVDPSLLVNNELFFNAARLDRSMALRTKDYLSIVKPRIAEIAKTLKVQKIVSAKDTNLAEQRHSCAHLLAAAVMDLWPQAKRTIGPAIENGFYYDFDFGNVKITDANFLQIEQKMHELVKKWSGFTRTEITKSEALKFFAGNQYKKELINEFSQGGETLTLYKSGEFSDLCRGGHVDNPVKTLKFFKLLKVSGAYWRGDEKNKMLTRIYGTCWPTKAELDKYLWQLEEAKKRDHRKFGKEMDLFTFSDLVGSGLPLFTQRGALVRRLITDYIEKIQSQEGYQQVWTPQIAKAELFKVSGHYDKYKENLFRVVSNYSDEEFYLKPMNCPQHTQIYQSQPRSYRDLPIRMTDFAMLYRDEKPGELSGLARVRSFSQDDCHVFCREDQVDTEVDRALTMTKKIMSAFGFKYRYRLSTHDPEHPEKYVGDPKIWLKVEKWAEKIMERNQIDYFTGVGEAAFYAPKMDLMATDALGREWQLSTVQIDFFLPERFGLEYTDINGKKVRPVMIHRAIVGSPERFMMVLLEHYAGKLPVWLSPVQITLIPIAERHLEAAQKAKNELKSAGFRAEVDRRPESMQAKIRDATLQKIPYMAIIGDQELKTPLPDISVRTRDGQNLGQLTITGFLEKLNKDFETKR